MEMNDFLIGVKSSDSNILNSTYRNFINRVFATATDGELERWELYNQIMGELVKLGHTSEFEEIKYRLTDGEDPCSVFSSVVGRVEGNSMILFFLKQIEGYIESDKYSRFYI